MTVTSDFYEACTNKSVDGNPVLKILKHHPHLIDRTFDNPNEDTPLIVAASRGCIGAVRCLLENGAKINRKNKLGETALMAAVQASSLQTVQFLVASSSLSLNDTNLRGETAFMLACKLGDVAVVKELLKYKPDIAVVTENGDDAWEVTCESTPNKTTQPIIRSLMDNFTHVYIAHDWSPDQFNYIIDEERLYHIQLELRRSYGLLIWYHRDHTTGDIRKRIETGLANTCCVVMTLTSRYRDKVNKTIKRKLYDPKDHCQYEYQTSLALVGREKVIPMIFEGKLAYLQEGSRDGDLGDTLAGNPNFIDLSDVYLTQEVTALENTTTSTLETDMTDSPASPSPFSPPKVSSTVTAQAAVKFKERCRQLYEVIRKVVFDP